MIEIILASALLILGIVLITKGSDWMTDSLIPVAERLGTSYIAVASILVSIMLSIPEVFVAGYAFFMGHPGISLGVIIGSIICNIGLMTGLSAMIKPLSVDSRVVIRDGVYAFIISIIVFLFGLDMRFDRSEGLILMMLFVPYVLNVWFFEKWASEKARKKELKKIKNYKKIAITETFGADIFTLLITLGLLAVIMPFSIDKRWLFFDIPIMIFMTTMMMLFIFKGHVRGQNAIQRHEGAILVLLYIAFIIANVLYLS